MKATETKEGIELEFSEEDLKEEYRAAPMGMMGATMAPASPDWGFFHQGYYRTRDGKRARVVCADGPDACPLIGYLEEDASKATADGGLDICTWTRSGSFLGTDDEYEYDLVKLELISSLKADF